MEKLRLISKSQRFRLACSAVFVFLVLAQFLRSGSAWWGAAFVFAASFLYFRRTANMLAALPLFMGAVFAPFFFPHNLTTPISTLFAAVIAGLFYSALGTKDLILIRRETLLEAGAYVFSYIALVLFFMQVALGAFLSVWLFAVFAVWLSLYLLAHDYRLALLLAVLMGELMWIVAWLPIGFLNSASICFAAMLFMGDTVGEDRIRFKNTAILGALITLILVSSRFSL